MSVAMSRHLEKGWVHRRTRRSQKHPEKYDCSSRCLWMYQEALEFQDSIEKFEIVVLNFQQATSDFMQQCIPLLRMPLPRVWDAVEGGLAEPIRATVSHEYPHISGGEYHLETLTATELEFDKRMKQDVVRPLGQWTDAMVLVKERMPELEKLRGEADKHMASMQRVTQKSTDEQRRLAGARDRPAQPKGVSGMIFACTHPRTANEPLGYDEVASGIREDDREVDATYKTRKYEAIQSSLTEQEGLVGDQLAGLCRDAAWMKSYVVAALMITKETMQIAVAALGPTKQPLPSFGLNRAAGAVHGAVATNHGLIGEMPQFLESANAITSQPHYSDHIRRRARDHVRPHKATAQPLELHACEDVAPGDAVPETRRGATDLPLSSVGRGVLGSFTGGDGGRFSGDRERGSDSMAAQRASGTFRPSL